MEFQVGGDIQQHRLPEVGQAGQRADGGVDLEPGCRGAAVLARCHRFRLNGRQQLGLELLQVRIEADAPREIAGIDHVVDLVGGAAAAGGRHHRPENPLPEGVDIGGLRLRVPGDIDDVGGGDLAEADVVVGDGQGGGALGVDHQEEVFGATTPPGRRGGGQDQEGEDGGSAWKN